MPKTDSQYMSQAIAGAINGQGSVEPNPMVGCLIVAGDDIIGFGWHEKFGSPHAEVNALNSVKTEDQERIEGATVYVTLEPCSHHGKTGPCCEALIKAKVKRVVVAVSDPNPQVAGQGIAQLKAAGILVTAGVMEHEAKAVLAPYLKRIQTGFPWIIAKWAMTVDGKIATASGNSQWITNKKSRSRVHDLRRRCDAVVVGIGTALADDPMLNPRPAGDRKVIRAVIDSAAKIELNSKLVQTANEHRTLIAVGLGAGEAKTNALIEAGCEVWRSEEADANKRLLAFLKYLAGDGCTNVMVEGGGTLLGALNDLKQIDETHVFVGQKLLGGRQSITPVGGDGSMLMGDATGLKLQSVQRLDGDIYAIYRK